MPERNAPTLPSQTPVPQRASARNRILWACFVLATTLVCYVGTLNFDFVYDDREQIVENYRIQSWQYVPSYFSQHVWSHISPKDPSNFYRPAFLLWLRINHALFGLHPGWWHLTTILLHLLVTLLVFLLANRIGLNEWCAAVAALIFGIHPVHLEAVAWISGVTEPLLAIGFIASLLAYLKWRSQSSQAWPWIVASLMLFAIGLLTKETAIILPVFIMAWEIVFPSSRGTPGKFSLRTSASRVLRPAIPFILIAALYLAVRKIVLGEISHAFTPLPLKTLLLTAPSLLWFYLKHLCWPFGQSAFYDQPYVSTSTVKGFLAPAAMLVLVLALLTRIAHRSRPVTFAGLWLLLPILPVLNLRVFAEGDIAHDRYLYLPSVGFAVLSALLLAQINMGPGRWFGQSPARLLAVAGLALTLAVGTVAQSLFWSNDLLLAYRGYRVAPSSAYAANYLALTLAQRGLHDEATKLYQKSIARRPGFWEPHYNLGLLNYRLGQLDAAERYLAEAIRINPYDPREYLCLGFVKLQAGQAAEAEKNMRRAIEIQPQGSAPYMALGVVLESQGDLAGALRQFRIAVVNDPGRTSVRREIEAIEGKLRQQGTEEPKAIPLPPSNAP
jgi:tetratricopeptide (TPR) repeat protein